MVEFSVPALVSAITVGNISSYAVEQAESHPQQTLMSVYSNGTWRDISAQDFLVYVNTLAQGLVAAGVAPGDRVGLMSKTRYEWTAMDFAIWSAGAVTVPVYETSSQEQTRAILHDSGVIACVVEDAAHAKLLGSIRHQLPALRDVWHIEAGGLDDLVAAGMDIDPAVIVQRRNAVRPEDLATVVYTSGTTGQSRGCQLTHGNFIFLVENITVLMAKVLRAPEAATLIFLPLAHVLGRIAQVIAIRAGARVGHCGDPAELTEAMLSFHPTFIFTVPRLFEKIYNGSEARAESRRRGRLFRRAAKVARQWNQARTHTPGERLSFGLRIRHACYDYLVYRKIRAALGGKLSCAVSGGAPLNDELNHFFHGIGVNILEGYGLTETTAPSTVNTAELTKVGTVGPPLPGVSVRIAPDGEVFIRGPHVMSGYWRDPDGTKTVLDDDRWFATGDLGSLDDDGYLTINGRKKEMIVTSSGKNIAPAPLEDRIRAHPLIAQCVLVGDQRPFIGALITLDADMLPTWLANHDYPPMNLIDAVDHDGVTAAIHAAVDNANIIVSRAESVRNIKILTTDLTIATGHLTPSLKVKRSVVLRDFAQEIDELYR
ncbi:MAG: AMP-dependent synthetase/ligase [Actinomycetota bacterium]